MVPFDAGSLPALGEGLDLVLAQYRPQPGLGCARLTRVAFVVVAGRDHPTTLRPFDVAAALPLTLLDVPSDLPAFDLAMYWHPRVEADPLVGWVRGQLAAASMPMGKMR